VGGSDVRKDETGRRKKKCDKGKLFSLREDIFETHAGPADRTCVGRESDRVALDSPSEPVEKLFFFAFDNHRITSNAKRMNQRTMRVQFICKPVRPFRDSGNPVDVGDGSSNKSLVRACQQRPSRTGRHSARSELLRHANEVTQRLLSPGKL